MVLQQNFEPHYEEEFNLFLFSLLLLGLIIVCICVFIGVLITVLLLLAIFALILTGALSGSLLVGLNKRSFTAGFRTFVILFSAASCTFLAGIGLWLLNKLLHWWTNEVALFIGSISGLIGGITMGFLIAYLIRIITTFLKSKLLKFNKTK